jgi:hypothetical protein
MVAYDERSVSPTPEHGTEQAIDAAALQLAREIRAYAQANPQHGIPAGQRLTVAQTLAFDSLIPLLVAVHDQLDDIFPGAKTQLERKRDVLLNMLTTYMLPELLNASAEAATGEKPDHNRIHTAVYGDVDSLFDFVLHRANDAVREAKRTV